MNKGLLLLLSIGLTLAGAAQAAEIVPINVDPAGKGLNDTTARAPEGGNPGTTIGEQRRIVYQYAADLWGSVLQSDVQIRVQASFEPLTCDATGATLGSAGPATAYLLTADGQPTRIYPAALSDALIGTDLQNGAGVDIVSRFNSSWGGSNPDGTPCSPGSGWYYGLDGKTPAGQINFLNVVMHEIGHGLGFLGFGNVNTGAPLAGYQDIFSSFVYDDATQKGWYELTNAGRVTAEKAGKLVFRGPNVTAQVPLVLGEALGLRASGNTVGNYEYGTAVFGPAVTTSNFNGQVVVVNDGSAAPTQGCSASPAGAYAGKIALVDRGTCGFELKTKNAQDAGAIAVIVANNTAGILNMADDPTITAIIPAVMISQADGAAIKAGTPGVSVAVAAVPGWHAGADAAGYARLYAPATLQPGSTFSHYDVSATPNALMEPAITDTLNANLDLDLTPAAFQDIGWTLNPGTALINGCDTGVPVISTGGIIIGASVQARDDMCLATSPNKGTYQTCLSGYKDQLATAGLLQGNQGGRIASCGAQRFKK